MTNAERRQQYISLSNNIRQELSTWGRKDAIRENRIALLKLQEECPHLEEDGTPAVDEAHCPYCGKSLN